MLARFEDGAPAIYSIPNGRGRYVYVGFLPGQLSYQPRTAQKTVVGEYHPARMLDLMRSLALNATGHADRIVVDGRGIISSAWQNGDRVWVRIVNVGGTRRLPVGKPVGKAKPTYPTLGRVQIRVHMPVESFATLVTPDQGKPIPIALERNGPDSVVSIPPDTFRTSAFVRLEVEQ